MKKLIAITFYTLFSLVPLVFHTSTSELFEFNKMVLTYTLTVIIVGFWISRMIIEKRLIFRRTILDIPLLLFLITQLLSTIFSIDFRTSLLGYYSRFHGGFMSFLSYTFLYWAFVSNMRARDAQKAIRALIISAVIVSIWGILEHFGHSLSCLLVPAFRTFDVSCWVQDVQNRVYASIGQPNWLAAWIVALLPLTWAKALSSVTRFPSSSKNLKLEIRNFLIWLMLSAIFFLTLLYTNSRSGILAFILVFIIFWLSSFLLFTFNKVHTAVTKKLISINFFIVLFTTISIILAVGTPWTPKLSHLLSKSINQQVNNSTSLQSAPALETGGTESEKIRAIVWKGAFYIWKNYPILGTGVETFAFSYYNFRPVEHNLVSEWDFLYNKAHNEYLNYAATTGTVGLLAYAGLIISTIILFCSSGIFAKNANYFMKTQKPENFHKNVQTFCNFSETNLVTIALFSGYLSILVTNFFGFSVVPVALEFFLYPALVVSLADKQQTTPKNSQTLKGVQTICIIAILLLVSYFLFLISKYWYADLLFAKAKVLNDSNNSFSARNILASAINLSPNEAIYWSEIAQASANLALIAQENSNTDIAQTFAVQATSESAKATDLSPGNVNLKRDRATIFIKLSLVDPNYLVNAKNELEKAIVLAPTEAKLFYNLGLVHLRLGDNQKALEIIEKTINMKPNYKEARYASALINIDLGNKEVAKEELKYILEHLSPEDKDIQRELDELQ